MSILTSLYDGLKDNERVKDLGFAILGGTLSIIGTRALGIGIDKDEDDNEEDFEDDIEDD
mgnify:CR=1 FL=1|jgi:hypothetical protein|tara:strand:+ start:501 stop:680 length:180 start_codon:yes stop_codon:yes gene_type:complete